MRLPACADRLVDGVVDTATDHLPTTVRPQVEAVRQEVAVRGGAAWDALRGERVGPPVAVARWPVAVAAAMAGAAAGVAVAVAVRRFSRPDAPDAQRPEDVEAVVDRPV